MTVATRVLAVVLVLLVMAVPAFSRCWRYPAYVYEGEITDCRPATVNDFNEQLEWVLFDPEDSLRTYESSIVSATILRFVQVARCEWEKDCVPAVTDWSDVSPTEFEFQIEGGCSALPVKVGHAGRFFAVRPCCDVEPPKSPRCAIGAKLIQDPPSWAVDTVAGQ